MKKRKKGFTLVELIVTIAITGIVTSLLYNILNSNVQMFILGRNQADLQAEVLNIREQVDMKVKGAETVHILDPSTFNEASANPEKSYIYDKIDTTTGKRVVYYKEGSLPAKALSKDATKDYSITFVEDNSNKILKYRVEGVKKTSLGEPETYHIDASARLTTDTGEGITPIVSRSNVIEIEYDPVELPIITNFTIIGQDGINYTDYTANGVVDKKNHTIKVKLKTKGANYKARIVYTGTNVVRINKDSTTENELGGQRHYAIDDSAIINDTATYRVYSGDKYVDYEVTLEFEQVVEDYTYYVKIKNQDPFTEWFVGQQTNFVYNKDPVLAEVTRVTIATDETTTDVVGGTYTWEVTDTVDSVSAWQELPNPKWVVLPGQTSSTMPINILPANRRVRCIYTLNGQKYYSNVRKITN